MVISIPVIRNFYIPAANGHPGRRIRPHLRPNSFTVRRAFTGDQSRRKETGLDFRQVLLEHGDAVLGVRDSGGSLGPGILSIRRGNQKTLLAQLRAQFILVDRSVDRSLKQSVAWSL